MTSRVTLQEDPANRLEQALGVAASPDDGHHNRRLTRSRTDILDILDGVKGQGGEVFVYLGLEENFHVSSILEVDRGAGSILFDHTLERYKNRAGLLQKAGLMFECSYKGARIRFRSAQACEALSDGRPAFKIPTPEFIWWFQPRRQPRYAVHPFDSLKIALGSGNSLSVEADVVDVSQGGLGLVTRASNVHLEAGQVLKNCALILPGVGRVVLDLQVKYANAMPTEQGQLVKRVGCELTGLSAELHQLIKHYIMGLRRNATTASSWI